MAHKTGISHASSVLLGLLSAELLVHYCRPAFPNLILPVEEGIRSSSQWITRMIGVPLHHEMLIPAVVAALLAFLWGMIYHVARHGR